MRLRASYYLLFLKGTKINFNSRHLSLTRKRRCVNILNADLLYVSDVTWTGIWTSGQRLYQPQTLKQCTDSHMCNLWQCSNLWGSSFGAPALLPQGLQGDWKTGLSHKMKWSVQLCAPASTGGSPHSALLGVRYTLERHAGIIRDTRNWEIAMNYTAAGG